MLEPQGIGGCDCLTKTQVYAKSKDNLCGLTPARYSKLDNGCDSIQWKVEQTAAVTLTVLR
jgi:hypothetical protein